MGTGRIKRISFAAIATVAAFSLGGCLILPGEFDSAMTVRQNGDFSFSYKGQIQLVGLSNLLNNELLKDAGAEEFKAVCWSDTITPASDHSDKIDTGSTGNDVARAPTDAFQILPARHWRSMTRLVQDNDATVDPVQPDSESTVDAVDVSNWGGDERPCTPAEVEKQKTEWDSQQAEKKKRDEQGRKMAEMMLGGIDPENPETIKRFTREVERLSAWHKVEHLGNGVFMVDYSTTGRLPDDFAFPVIPRYALGEPMIHASRWDNGRARIEAPAFKTDPEMSMSALIGMGSMASGLLGKTGSDKAPAQPVAITGRFTLSTDARILANNSEEGPEDVGGMQKLVWDIGPASYGAPMALLKLN